MIDITDLTTVVTSLKTAGDIAKTAIGLRDAQALQSKVIELNVIILSAQQSALSAQLAQTSLIERVRELEQQLAQLENWNTEKTKYELRDIAPGVSAYTLKGEKNSATPARRFCARCFEHRVKSVLQREEEWDFGERVKCHECGSELTIREQPIYMRNPRRDNTDNGGDAP